MEIHVTETGRFNIQLSEIKFQFPDNEVFNDGPIIVIETNSGFMLLAGWANFLELLNVGVKEVEAILVDEFDLFDRGVLGEQWVDVMCERYK